MIIVFLDFDDIKNPLLNAGQARSTYELGRRLSKKHGITVVSSRYPGSVDRVESGIQYVHIGIGTKHIRLNNFFYILFLPFFVRKIRADVIFECFTAPISTLFSPLFTKIPVIGIPSMFNATEFSKKYHLPFHLIESFGMKFYKYMIAYSDIDGAKINRLNPKIERRIIPQGVDASYLAISYKNPQHILFLSRFDVWQKGIDLLLHAYAMIKDKIPYRLVIAGHGPDEKKIQKIISELSLEDRVTIVGSAYGEKKIDLISRAIFCAFPSRHDELSLWALEALASGLPIVAFDLPECKWIDKAASLKAKPFDIADYAQLLIDASDPIRNNKMRIHARELARKYSWDVVVSQYEEYIHDVINKEAKS